MLELTSLPAKQGDAIWIKWGDSGDPHHMIVDMGTGGIGKNVRTMIEGLPGNKKRIDLLVITHVDADHIGGVLTCLAEADPIPDLSIDDVWFNGFEHLTGKTVETQPGLEPLGPVQGEKLSIWLRSQNWNDAFDRGPVSRVPGQPIRTIALHDDLKLTVLGPTPDRLSNFVDTWNDVVKEAIEKGRLDAQEVSPGLEPMGADTPPELVSPGDLEALAILDDSSDNSKANGSSIALLLEYKNRKVILAGDAFGQDLVDGINAASGGNRLHIDLFKLPHHGSKKNVDRALVESVDCDRWLISTDGTRFKHPDAEAVARIISFSSDARPILSFNVPSKFNGWWTNPDWIDMYEYSVETGDPDTGLTIEFELNN